MNRADGPLLRKLGGFVALSDRELALLRELQRHRRAFSAGRDFVRQGHSGQSAYVLIDDWACSYKLLPGGARQIVDVQVPGDFIGIRSLLLRISDHSVEPVTDVTVAEVKASDILEIVSEEPRLATALLWAASRDEAMVVEHLVGLGRRSARERVAHFLLELSARLTLIGWSDRTGYECPLNQYLLADALGLSAVHVNRVLRALREDGLVTFRDGRVAFGNIDALISLTDFDPAYLDQTGPLVT